MIRDFLSNLHWSTLPVISMFLFISVFLGAVIWVFRKESTEVYQELGALPLEKEGNQHG